MVNFRLVPALLSLSAIVLCASSARQHLPPAAFIHANLITMESDRVIPNQTVVVAGGSITAVGSDGAVPLPANALVIDASGKYLLPGLADMHVHVSEPEDLIAWLAHGVTTVLNLNGFPQHLAWRKQISEGTMEGPTLYTSGPTIYEAASLRAGDSLAEAYHDAGYDCLKIYNDVTSEGYDGIIRTAKKYDMLTVGHIPRAPKFETVLKSGMAIAHAEEFIYTIFHDSSDDARIPEVVRMVQDAHIAVIATLTAYEHITKQVENLDSILAQPELNVIPPWIRETWSPDENRYSVKRGFKIRRLEERLAFQKRFVAALHRAGVPVLAGTDAVFNGMVTGKGTLRELEDLVGAGFTPYEALRSATTDAARFLRASSAWGTITPGKRADLVLCDANPLEEISAIEAQSGVMARGRWYPREELRRKIANLPSLFESQQAEFLRDIENNLAAAVRFENEHDPNNFLMDRSIRGLVRAGKFDALVSLLNNVRRIDPGTWSVREVMINNLGYQIMATKEKIKGAIAIFKLNTELYPGSANTFDSLAEAYLNDGDKEKARAYYTKALEIDPGWQNAKTMLGKIK